MARKPDAAAELAARLVHALEAQQGGPFPTTVRRLLGAVDPEPAPALVAKALGKLKGLAVVATKTSLDAPIALVADADRLAASPELLLFALEQLGPPKAPWTLAKAATRVDPALRPLFKAETTRRAAEGTLPQAVLAQKDRRGFVFYLRHQPPPPPPEVVLTQRVREVLETQRQQGDGAYPVRLSRLKELVGPAKPTVLKKALTSVVALVTGRGVDAPIALAEDVTSAVASPAFLGTLLDISQSEREQAFVVSALKQRLVKAARVPFEAAALDHLTRGTLPPGLGWVAAKQGRLVFRLQDVHAVAKAPALDFDSAFDAAFARLDREHGSNNYVSLVELRQAVPCARPDFDAALARLRAAGRYALRAAEGRHGLSPEQQAAGIAEEGALLLFVSRRAP